MKSVQVATKTTCPPSAAVQALAGGKDRPARPVSRFAGDGGGSIEDMQ